MGEWQREWVSGVSVADRVDERLACCLCWAKWMTNAGWVKS